VAKAEDDKTKPNKNDKEKKINSKQYLAELGYAMELINSDPSLQEFIVRVRDYMKNNENRTPTSYELDGMKQGIEWFEKYNSDQEKARIDQADPRTRDDFERSLKLKKDSIIALSRNYGVEFDDAFLTGIALDARLDNLTDQEIQARFTPFLEKAIVEGADLGGRAAEFERGIVQWAQKNGLQLSGNSVAKYVAAGVEGRSTLEDIKNDLRRTYLSGSYPAWSDRIMQGDDPVDIAAPYKQRMARMLEMGEDEIDLNDQLLQKAMQGVGADGKPSVTPLYEFDRQIREDPRWPQTDNAYEIYTRAGTDLLKTFGFR
jgi:hypothetical protein